MGTITTLKRATKRRASSEEAWRSAIRDARAEGQTFRAIADAAGVSHVRVQQILRNT